MLHRLKTEYRTANMYETFKKDNKSTVKRNISQVKTIVEVKSSSIHIVDETVTTCKTWFQHFKLNSNMSSFWHFRGILCTYMHTQWRFSSLSSFKAKSQRVNFL